MQNNYICAFSQHFYFFVFLQHVLIIVKIILVFLIPDEPEWVRQKRERIEYISMQALKQQVCPIQYRCILSFSLLGFSFIYVTICLSPPPEASRVLNVFQRVEVVLYFIQC